MSLARRLAYVLIVFLVSLTARAQNSFTTVVIFGDSLSDTGNIAHLTQSQFLIRYPADNPVLGFDYTDGRFTDGADTQPAAKAYFGVWAEQLAASFAAKPTIKDSLDGGTDYAYGDATTQNGTSTIMDTFAGVPVSVTVHNMGQQVTDYLATTPTPNAQTLYILWGGANDLYADDSAAGVTGAVQREVALVQRLIAAGGTSFMVPNLPPLGGVPQYATGTNAAALNTASASFAAQLAAGLASVKSSAAAGGKTITIYQPDIFTAFTTAATNPMAVGLGNVSSAAQNIAASPDTYLIWDGLHPTTTGHHYVAAAAANLITPLVASTATLTVPPVMIVVGSVTLKAVVSSTASATKPTGLVTFFSAGAVIGSAALDATGTGTATFSGATVAGSPYNITAVYAGDTTFNPTTSAAQALAIISSAVGTTTTVNSSNLAANQGSSVTFTAVVTPAVGTYGSPTGTITFLDGMSTLGTGTVANGSATYTTTSLAAGSHTITASYAASGIFGASTSPAITEVVTAPAYTAAASPNPLTIARGASGTSTITVTPVGGYSGTLTLACGTLPAHLGCSFSSATLTLSGSNTAQTSTLTIATNASVSALEPFHVGPGRTARVFSAAIFFPAMAGVFLITLRRRKSGLPTAILLLLISAGAVVGIGGCGSNNDAASGTYTVPVTVTPASGGATNISLQVVVQ